MGKQRAISGKNKKTSLYSADGHACGISAMTTLYLNNYQYHVEVYSRYMILQLDEACGTIVLHIVPRFPMERTPAFLQGL